MSIKKVIKKDKIMTFLTKHKITKSWILAFTIFIVIFYFLAWLCPLPISGEDDYLYVMRGNPFLLQWQEYLSLHGRYFTHTLLRITLQAGEPYMYLIKTIVVFFLFLISIHQINPYFWKKDSPLSFFSAILFISFCLLMMGTTFFMFSYTEYTPIFSNFLTVFFILWFFSYYRMLFENSNQSISLPVFILLSFFTGTTHEQTATLLPMVIIVYFLLKLKKIAIPFWFWIGPVVVLLGYLVIILAPTTTDRIHTYANATEWQWINGTTIDWTVLGWKKYLYSWFRHVFMYVDSYWGPGYLPSTGPLHIVFFFFFYLVSRKVKNFLDLPLLIPALYYIFSWGLVSIMMFSPMFTNSSIDFCRFFLYIALMGVITSYLSLYQISKKIIKTCSYTLILVLLIGISIQIPAYYSARNRYIQIRSIFEKAYESGETSVLIPPLPNPKVLGFSIFRHTVPTQQALNYYNVTEYTITNP